MKIILVNKYYYQRDGSTTSFFDMKRILEAHGHEVIPFSVAWPQTDETPYAKYFVSPTQFRYAGTFRAVAGKPLSALKGFFTMLYSFEAKRKFGVLLRDAQPDIVHIHNIYHQISPSILHAARKRNIPVVHTVHDYKLICPNYKLFTHGRIDESCKGGKFYRDAFNRSIQGSVLKGLVDCIEMYLHRWSGIYRNVISHWIAPSEFVKNKLTEFGMPAERIRVIPHSIDASAIEPSFESGEYVLYAGRLSEEKGVSTLIAAMKDVSAPLLIAGSGPEEERLKRQAAECGVVDRVSFLGFKSHEEILSLMRNAALIVVPSEWYEVFGYTALEAAACGKAVLLADIGALPELFPSKVAFFFRAGDAHDLSRTLNEALSDPEALRLHGMAARAHVQSVYAPENFYEKLMNIYEKVLSSATPNH